MCGESSFAEMGLYGGLYRGYKDNGNSGFRVCVCSLHGLPAPFSSQPGWSSTRLNLNWCIQAAPDKTEASLRQEAIKWPV